MSDGMHGTTILSVRRGENVVIIGDGQVTLGSAVIKSSANKIRVFDKVKGGKKKIVAGFAGATADAFALLSRLEAKLEAHPNNLKRACVELAKDWRMDKYLRRLEAMLIVANSDISLILTGNGDVVEPEYDVAAIGSGGHYALSAAMALIDCPDITISEIANRSMSIASRICIYTSDKFSMESIGNCEV